MVHGNFNKIYTFSRKKNEKTCVQLLFFIREPLHNRVPPNLAALHAVSKFYCLVEMTILNFFLDTC